MTGRKGETVTWAPEMAKMLATLSPLPPWERAYAVQTLLEEYQGLKDALVLLRLDAVRELRAEGLTQAEIGDLLGVTRWTVGLWEKEHAHATARAAQRAAAGVPPDDQEAPPS